MSPGNNASSPPTSHVTAYIGIGSNLHDPLQQVLDAFQQLATLPHSELTRRSCCYFSDPVGPGPQPDYVNAVGEISTSLSPLQLLDELQRVEQEKGRTRHQRWAPRVLDLDILLYDNREINDERLLVPHPEMRHRDFVLLPLLEIAADVKLPGGVSASELLANCRSNNLRKIDLEKN